MLAMALELAARRTRPTRTWRRKFFEHFVAIADAMNTLGGTGLLGRGGRLLLRPAAHPTGSAHPAAGALDGRAHPAVRRRDARADVVDRLPGFKQRMQWFLENRPDLAEHVVEHASARTAASRRLLVDRPADAARARAALHARRGRVPLAVRHPLAVARPPRRSPYVLARRRRRSTASTTSPASRPPGCSAATRTGAGRSGSRSTTC